MYQHSHWVVSGRIISHRAGSVPATQTDCRVSFLVSVNCDIAGVCFHPALGLVLLQASGLAQTEEKAEEAGSEGRRGRQRAGCWLLVYSDAALVANQREWNTLPRFSVGEMSKVMGGPSSSHYGIGAHFDLPLSGILSGYCKPLFEPKAGVDQFQQSGRQFRLLSGAVH